MNRDALVVGINTYRHLKSLKAPAQDAEAIARLLETDGEFRVTRMPEAIAQDETRKPVIGETLEVSQPQLKQALKQLFRPESAQPPDTALFYFSGHGIPDTDGYDKGYLATSDTNASTPESGLSLRWLQWLLSESPIKQQIIWLDCCHSGGLLVSVDAANPGHENQRDRCFIASSRDFETSWQDLNSPYSVLTKALLEGLDPTRLPGRWIDSFALVDYVNQALKGELQSPVCTNFGNAINLTRSWQVDTDAPKASLGQAICPYKGLEYFDCNDHDPQFFFGRESLTDQLLDNVRTSNFLALVGASGSGKSSVLRAGLLHQLKVGRRIAGSDQWQILIMRPDATPMKNLAEVFVDPNLAQLDRAADLGKAEGLLKEGGVGLGRLVQASLAPRVVLVIDQFEEAFTRCDDLEQRQQFFDCVLGALQQEPDKLCVILAMRADFVGKCLEQAYSGLARMVEQQLVSVLPMTQDELTDAICKPAEQVGTTVEPLLVQTILKEIQGAPGRLPLLQYALTQVWNEASGGELTLAGYQRLGGIDGTLQSRATRLYEAFTEEEQATCRHIFLALTQLGEGTEDTRRRVAKQDLVTALHPQARIDAVLNKLTSPDNRLLVTSEMTAKGSTHDRMAIVDVAHEALIRHWSLLRQWIETNRDRLRQQRRIETASVEWREQGKQPGYLLQGLPLIEAKQFQQQQAPTFPLSESANHFIQQSIRQQSISRLKTASWLLIPALLIGGAVEYQIREQAVKEDYARLNDSGYEETKAVQDLVRGCESKWLPYLGERLFGNCRSLVRAPLAEADLRYADISYADISYADISYADISYADIIDTNLRYADLRYADLSYADISSADLSYAILHFAILHSTDLHSAILINTDLRYADLSSADLRYAVLRYTDLRYAVLSSADLRYAVLRYTDLRSTDIRSADLSSADLSSTNIRSTDLSSANLRFADLSSADLSSADLSSANLSSTNLSSTNLNSTNLRSTDIGNAILLATDFHNSQNLTPEQFTSYNSPVICNVALPQHILDAGIDPERDCDRMAQVLIDRYGWMTLENAQQIVDEARQKTWGEPTDTPTE